MEVIFPHTVTASAQTVKPRVKRKTGRPTKLNATIQAAICQKLREGQYPEQAAVAMGVARRTFFEWLERGRNGEPLYAEFRLAVDQAIAEWELVAVKRANEDPRNTMELLSRRFPDRWGKRDRTQVDVSVTSRPYIDASKYTTDQLKQLQELLAIGAPDDLPSGGVSAHELVEGFVDGVVVAEELL